MPSSREARKGTKEKKMYYIDIYEDSGEREEKKKEEN
jgi:hypothetical protein